MGRPRCNDCMARAVVTLSLFIFGLADHLLHVNTPPAAMGATTCSRSPRERHLPPTTSHPLSSIVRGSPYPPGWSSTTSSGRSTCPASASIPTLSPSMMMGEEYQMPTNNGRGSSPFVPSIFFNSGAPLFFLQTQKTDRRRTNRVRFLT